MGYLKPLRRKFGVLTLVLACVFAVVWVRSLSVSDRVGFYATRYWAASADGRFAVGAAHGAIFYPPLIGRHIYWNSHKIPPGAGYFPNPDWTWYVIDGASGLGTWRVSSPFSTFLIPLMLLSAWLLLSKPRQKPAVPNPISLS